MRHILFEIPLPFGDAKLPVFGYGVMLLIAFFSGVMLAERRARKEGITSDTMWDLALWVFGFGLIGARLTSMVLDPVEGNFWKQCLQFFRIWEGGMVIYGGIPGGLVGYAIAHRRFLKKQGIRILQVADLVAPSLALGLAFGRIGCLLNGCCYGDVADPYVVPAWQAMQFPANSPPQEALVREGYQTAYGFLLAASGMMPMAQVDNLAAIAYVEPGSPAEHAGLRPEDVIVAVGTTKPQTLRELHEALKLWPRLEPLTLKVKREAAGEVREVDICFELPRSLAVHPTQIYSSINAFLLVALLLAYTPYRRREGAVMAMLMMLNGGTRIILEMIRLDNPVTLTGLTVSQNAGALLVLGGMTLMLWVQLRNPPSAKTRSPD